LNYPIISSSFKTLLQSR